MRWRLRKACRLVVDHPRAAHLSSTPSGPFPPLQSLCSRDQIIDPARRRTHASCRQPLPACRGDSTSACRLRTGAPSWRSTIRRRPCEKANIGERILLATVKIVVLDRALLICGSWRASELLAVSLARRPLLAQYRCGYENTCTLSSLKRENFQKLSLMTASQTVPPDCHRRRRRVICRATSSVRDGLELRCPLEHLG